MESLDLKFELDETQRQYRDNLVRRLKQDPGVQKFLAANKLDASVVEKNSSLFSRWQKQKKTCANCRGLNFCQMQVRGNFCDLQADSQGFLNEVYVPCRFLRQQRSQTGHSSNFTLSHMQGKDYLVSFETLSQTLEQEPRPYWAVYTQAVSSLPLADGCLFYGQPGTGKSTLMMALANAHAKMGMHVAYVRVPLLISELKEHLNDDIFRMQTLSRMRHADVLFLDDFGSESATPWTRDEILFPILDERMNNHKKTYFASNIQLSELFERYALGGGVSNSVAANRLVDRVRTLAKPLELTGLSRRRSPQ